MVHCMKDELVIKPDKDCVDSYKLIIIILFLGILSFWFTKYRIMIWIIFPFLIEFLLEIRTVLYTITMNCEGCIIQLGKKKKFFRWEDFDVIRYEKLKRYEDTVFGDERIFFAVNRYRYFQWFSSIMISKIGKNCFYYNLINDWEGHQDSRRHKKNNAYPRDDLILKLLQWNVKIENLPDIDINTLKIHKKIAYPLDEERKQWVIQVNNQEHTLCYVSKKECGKHSLYLDEKEIEIDKKSIVPFLGIDKEFYIDNQKFQFLVEGNKIDIATHKKYIDARKTYYPLKKRFVVIIVSLLVATLFFICTHFEIIKYFAAGLFLPVFLYMMVFVFLFMEKE